MNMLQAVPGKPEEEATKEDVEVSVVRGSTIVQNHMQNIGFVETD